MVEHASTAVDLDQSKMEELQDAIEDVQYMNAMHDGIPRPTQEWKWPSPEEFQIYLDKVKTTAPRSFEPEGLCRGSLGFYTVIASYSYHNYHNSSDELMKVFFFQTNNIHHKFFDLIIKITSYYLLSDKNFHLFFSSTSL